MCSLDLAGRWRREGGDVGVASRVPPDVSVAPTLLTVSECLAWGDLFVSKIYDLHLGLINAPPYFASPSKRYFSLFIYYQKGQK